MCELNGSLLHFQLHSSWKQFHRSHLPRSAKTLNDQQHSSTSPAMYNSMSSASESHVHHGLACAQGSVYSLVALTCITFIFGHPVMCSQWWSLFDATRYHHDVLLVLLYVCYAHLKGCHCSNVCWQRSQSVVVKIEHLQIAQLQLNCEETTVGHTNSIVSYFDQR